MTEFDDIRPYNDDEVRSTLDRILADAEFVDVITRLKFPRLSRFLGGLLRPLVKRVMVRQVLGVDTIVAFQHIVEKYLEASLAKTTTAITCSGLDKLDPTHAYLFISNHRDIAMDPAMVNWGLYHAKFKTLRIAIGDNLLTKPYVSDLMRLNKSFIVNRSATAPREKFKAAKKLSAYIYHSVVEEKENTWIAQREGRAKDGFDKTNSAVVGMLGLNRPKTEVYSAYIKKLSIVPVTLSYELDPCDKDKAHELYQQKTTGTYEKGQQEDIKTIAKGITGKKGHVHIAFGDVLSGEFENADAVVAEIDRQVWQNYVVHATNCFAYQAETPAPSDSADLYYTYPSRLFKARDCLAMQQQFNTRLNNIPEQYRDIVQTMYANPVHNKLKNS